ncbi:MAG TPA: phytoene desaturase family protein [Vineibacter sp.]|nr:phytoene desaturase family protein [Vineibacter sp.]
MRTARVVVVGAGLGGLVAALLLGHHGLAVTVVERTSGPGGKLRQVGIGNARLDAGPTVFTLRGLFEDILAEAGVSLSDSIKLEPLTTLARHAWGRDQRLDLFADIDRTVEAVGTFASPREAERYRAFCARARRSFQALDRPFIRASRPSLPRLMRTVGLRGATALWRAGPFSTLWKALGEHFHDERLRQLFGRYATYSGASPFLATATLMVIAHVEQEGVWVVDGGMHRIAEMIERHAVAAGVLFRYAAHVEEVVVSGGRPSGVRLASGEELPADAVVLNTDVAAVATGLLGKSIAAAVPSQPSSARSLSAVTWAMVAETSGFPLLHHCVFFSRNYQAEFDDIFGRRRLPAEPTVYVCAQDRTGLDGQAIAGPERLLCLVNAPPTGDTHPLSPSEVDACEERTFQLLRSYGLRIQHRRELTVRTTPAEFAQMFPATGGALYGQAQHGWMASFRRPGTRTRLPGLYLAGGSVHPGPGLPMVALSGRQAAAALLSDLASTGRSSRVAIPGGMSMR